MGFCGCSVVWGVWVVLGVGCVVVCLLLDVGGVLSVFSFFLAGLVWVFEGEIEFL